MLYRGLFYLTAKKAWMPVSKQPGDRRTVGRGETKVRQKSFWAILDFWFLSCPVERQHFEEYFSKIFHSDMFIKVVNFLLEIAKCDILRVSAYMMTKLKKQVISLKFFMYESEIAPTKFWSIIFSCNRVKSRVKTVFSWFIE